MNKQHSMVKMLLKNGAVVNEKIWIGDTPLGLASTLDLPYQFSITNVLLKYGADVNFKNKNGIPALAYAKGMNRIILHEKLAELHVGGHFICEENKKILEFERTELEKLKMEFIFDYFLDEFERMKSCKVDDVVSLFDILEMKKNPKKLIMLMRNKDFVAAYKSARKRMSLNVQGPDLDNFVFGIRNKSKTLDKEEKKLYSIFKNALPQLVINKVAYIINEELFRS